MCPRGTLSRMRGAPPIALVALAGGLVLAGLGAWAVAQPAPPWSADLAALAPRHADAGLDRAALDLSRATGPIGNALAALAVAGVLAAAARWRDLALLAVALGGAGILVWLLKLVVDADRPLRSPLGPAEGASFPSAHAAGWAALVTALALLVPRSSRVLVSVAGGLLVLAIGASRVYLGAHHPRDVVAGLALGVGWVALAAWAGSRSRHWRPGGQVRFSHRRR